MNTHQMTTYQENQIKTASPEQILLMLYDGAIRFNKRSIAGIEQADQAMKISGITKTIAIVTELSNSLNRDVGKHIAEDLDALYDFMIRELTAANIHNDIEKLKAVEILLVDLRKTWGEAVEINKQQKAAKAPTKEQTQAPKPVQQEVLNQGYAPPTGVRPPTPSPSNTPPANYTPFSISR